MTFYTFFIIATSIFVIYQLGALFMGKMEVEAMLKWQKIYVIGLFVSVVLFICATNVQAPLKPSGGSEAAPTNTQEEEEQHRNEFPFPLLRYIMTFFAIGTMGQVILASGGAETSTSSGGSNSNNPFTKKDDYDTATANFLLAKEHLKWLKEQQEKEKK